MRAAVYTRKSNEEDAEKSKDQKSVAVQEEQARKFIAKQGWTLDEASVYVDDAVSGVLFINRPRFQKMLRDAEAGAFQHVAVAALIASVVTGTTR